MSSPSPYKRRRPSLIKNFWIYRRLVAVAFVLGVLLWFMIINGTPVTVAFPFPLATLQSTTGIVILVSALVGSLTTALVMTAVRTWHAFRAPGSSPEEPSQTGDLAADRPPPDYAAKTTEGFGDFH